jgi:hypothetical protein
MSAETFRAVITGIIVCALGGLTIPGIFVVFALQSRVSRRDDYLRLMCDAFDQLRMSLRLLRQSEDRTTQDHVSRVIAITREEELDTFFDAEHEGCVMETYIRHRADRYPVLRSVTAKLARYLKDGADLKYEPRGNREINHRAVAEYLTDASARTEDFERGMRRIRQQIWWPWYTGIVVLAMSLILLHAGDLSTRLISSLVLRPLLLLLLLGVIGEFVAATISIRVILQEVDR